MRALRSYGEKDIRVVDVDEPTPSDDKVIVEVEWCGICGSDLHLFHMGPETMLRLPKPHTEAKPLIMGHEIAARVTHSPVPDRIPVGAPVILDPRLYCGSCHTCTSTAPFRPSSDPAAANETDDDDDDDNNEGPQTHGCASGLSFVGFTTATTGGFAEKMAVPPAAVHVLPMPAASTTTTTTTTTNAFGPDGLQHAALVEPLAVAWHAVKRAVAAGVVAPPEWLRRGGAKGRAKAEAKVRGKRAADVAALVVGAGPVGVAVAYVLRAWGVGVVVASETAAGRREGVRGLVDVVVDPGKESVVGRCGEATGGRGVDVVFECSGSRRVVGDVFGGLGWKAAVVVVALWSGDVPVPFMPLMYKECTVMASCAYNEKDLDEVVKAFAEGRFEGVERMITARISLEDIVEKGFEALDKPDNSHVKILITPKQVRTA